MKFNNELHKIHEINNFREMIDYTVEHYPNNIAYKFKKNFKKEKNIHIMKMKVFMNTHLKYQYLLIDWLRKTALIIEVLL